VEASLVERMCFVRSDRTVQCAETQLEQLDSKIHLLMKHDITLCLGAVWTALDIFDSSFLLSCWVWRYAWRRWFVSYFLLDIIHTRYATT